MLERTERRPPGTARWKRRPCNAPCSASRKREAIVPLGGRVIYIVDDAQRYVHYYAHLDEWARGLRVGDKVERGTYLGTVGTTGNAPANAPHRHYQLLRYRTDSRQWWSGEPVNPIPYLRRKGNKK